MCILKRDINFSHDLIAKWTEDDFEAIPVAVKGPEPTAVPVVKENTSKL